MIGQRLQIEIDGTQAPVVVQVPVVIAPAEVREMAMRGLKCCGAETFLHANATAPVVMNIPS